MVARILVAADAPMVVGILGHKLRREGHDVVAACGRDAARRALEASAFDCSVYDADLLEGRGMDAAPPCPWLAIVDGRDQSAALGAMHAGAAGIVATPFKPTDVAAQVTALLSMLRVLT